MENETNENANSENAENSNQEAPDATALQAKNVELEANNKQLFERAKKAEGFDKQEDGSWVKTEKPAEVKKKPEAKKETKSDEFGLLQETFLSSHGIKEADEIELAKKIQSETGKDWGDLVKSKYFKTELEGLREDRKNTKATEDVRGGGGQVDSKKTAAHYIAKGVPPTKEDIPDRKERTKIHRAMMKNAETSGKTFYND